MKHHIHPKLLYITYHIHYNALWNIDIYIIISIYLIFEYIFIANIDIYLKFKIDYSSLSNLLATIKYLSVFIYIYIALWASIFHVRYTLFFMNIEKSICSLFCVSGYGKYCRNVYYIIVLEFMKDSKFCETMMPLPI